MVARLRSPFPRCTFSPCHSLAGLGLFHVVASRPFPPTRREGALAFPALVRRRRVLCSSRAVRFPRYMCFVFLLSLHVHFFRPNKLSVFICRALSPTASHLRPSCCYCLHACLAPSLLRLSPFPRRSCRWFSVGLRSRLLFHVASAVRSFSHRLLACTGRRPGLP